MHSKKKIIKASRRFPVLFVSLWVFAMVSFIFTAVTNQLQLCAKMFTSVIWLMFVISDINMYLTGRIKFGRYSPMIVRGRNPLMFQTVAGLITIVSMSFMSFMVIKAFSSDFKIATPYEGRTRQIQQAEGVDGKPPEDPQPHH